MSDNAPAVITPAMVRQERERTGLTQKEMAKRLLVPERTYQKWEHDSDSNKRQIKPLYFKTMQDIPTKKAPPGL